MERHSAYWNDADRRSRSSDKTATPSMDSQAQTRTIETQTSLEKALDVCEALAGVQRGLSVSELSRQLRQPAPTVHRLLGVLKRRGYVRQDEDTARYSLTLKMLDL